MSGGLRSGACAREPLIEMDRGEKRGEFLDPDRLTAATG
jgi:hypothetical protein